MRSAFINGILAGFFIGIGGSVFLACDNKYLGAVFFTVALLCICLLDLYLFTGKVGFLADSHSGSDILRVILGLLGNYIGTLIVGLAVGAAKPAFVDTAKNMCMMKFASPFWAVLISAFFCGILMYAAVKVYKDKKGIAGILFCVPVFILAGFEHSIADMFYVTAARSFSLETVVFILLVIAGNAVGGLFVPVMKKLAEGKKNG